MFLGLMMTGFSLIAGDYTGQIRRGWNDRTKSAFRIKKSNSAIQGLDWVGLPLLSGHVASTTASSLLSFTATAANPNLITLNASSGTIAIQFKDGELAPISYGLILPDGYISRGDLIVIASSPSNVTTSAKLQVKVIRNNGAAVTLADKIISGGYAAYDVSYAVAGLASLVAGDRVQILIGRNDSTSGTGTLEIQALGLRLNEDFDYAD